MSDAKGRPKGRGTTVFQPAKETAKPAATGDEAAPTEPAKPKRTRTAPPKPAARTAGLGVGSVLNGIYEVTRFIARGGMGEVYEGVNTASDERVAIKVILPHLAADAKVIAAFKREARTLTQLLHPALVQYRVLAYEPSLDLHYIVTEFIDGDQLADLHGQAVPRPAEIRALARRLAAGLAAAHEFGVYHRDMSLDNVLLPQGRLDRAKIIDFGIAKTKDAKGTIVGDGFAGKLGFVAPEQFGEHGGHIGPWTDIYSLGLVVLGVARGRPVDMGATLVDAVTKRRTVPDLTALPEGLRPTFQRMLEPDPARRFQTMEEVMWALDGMTGPGQGDVVTPPPPPPPPPPEEKLSPPGARGGLLAVLDGLIAKGPLKDLPRPAVLASLAALVVVVVVMAAAVLGSVLFQPGGGDLAERKEAPPSVAPAAAPAESVRRAVEAALPAVGCSWIDVDSVTAGEISVSGAAGGGGALVNAALSKALTDAGLAGVAISTDKVFRVGQKSCALLDSLRALRVERPNSERLAFSEQPRYEIGRGVPGCESRDAEGKLSAKPVVTLHAPGDFAILQTFDSGELGLMYANRHSALEGARSFSQMGPGEYQLSACTGDVAIAAFVVLEGSNLDQLGQLGLREHFKGTLREVTPEQGAQLAELGRRNGWQAQLAWYEVVDQAPDVR